MYIETVAFGIMSSLLATAISKLTGFDSLNFFEKKKIQSMIDKAVAETIEPLIPWLKNENISDEKQLLLFNACKSDLDYFADNPDYVYSNSLNGQQLFDSLYDDKELPVEITDEDLSDIYIMLFPRIATIFCSILPLTKDWELRTWESNYSKLDQIATQIRSIVTTLDKYNKDTDISNTSFDLAKKSMLQRLKLTIDLTSLRADKSVTGRLLDFYVNPCLEHKIDKNNVIEISEKEGLLKTFLIKKGRYYITGEPGSGKSTWLLWLKHTVLSCNKDILPFIITLRGIDDDNLPTVGEIVKSQLGKHIIEDVTDKDILKWKNDGNYLFLLDGFDELKPSIRDTIFDWVHELIDSAPLCTFIITSRPLTTNHITKFSQIFILWRIMPFNNVRIVEYMNNWYNNTDLLSNTEKSVDVIKLANDWQQDITLAPLTSNPLLLSTLLMVHHLDGELPKGRAALYDRYVNGMLGIWDDRRNIIVDIPDFRLELKKIILSKLALYMIINSEDQINEDKIINIIEDILSYHNSAHDSKLVLRILRERTGLLVGPGIYSFVHKSVAEYFVAKLIVQGNVRDNNDNMVDRMLLFTRRQVDNWQVVLFIWAGLSPAADVEAFISECIKIKDYVTAAGILCDQYDRLDPNFRLNSTIIVLNNIKLQDNYHLVFRKLANESNEEYLDELVLETTRMRGIHHHQIYDLVEIAIKSSDIMWSVDNIDKKDIELSIWIFSCFYEVDYDVWLSKHENISSDFKQSSSIYYYIAEIVISKILSTNYGVITDVDNRKIAYLATKINQSYFINIPLSHILSYSDYGINWNQFNNLINCMKQYKFSKEDLQSTKNTTLTYDSATKGDILLYFLEKINDKQAEHIIEYVNELIETRDK